MRISSKLRYLNHLHRSQPQHQSEKLQFFEQSMTVACFAWSDVISPCPSLFVPISVRCLRFFKTLRSLARTLDPSWVNNYADERKLLQQPRRTLIGSFIGKNIFMATPLLRWYLEHGLVVDKIYEVVEYVPEQCFPGFADTFFRKYAEQVSRSDQSHSHGDFQTFRKLGLRQHV